MFEIKKQPPPRKKPNLFSMNKKKIKTKALNLEKEHKSVERVLEF